MNADALPHIETAELSARAAVDDGKILLHFIGTADARVVDSMASLLASLHREAQKMDTREVTIDFRQLDFMNSSCLKAFVSWVGNVRELAAERQYRLRFLSDHTKLWQRRSLDALRCLATDLIEVDRVGVTRS